MMMIITEKKEHMHPMNFAVQLNVGALTQGFLFHFLYSFYDFQVK